jgi:hypothetical protein
MVFRLLKGRFMFLTLLSPYISRCLYTIEIGLPEHR